MNLDQFQGGVWQTTAWARAVMFWIVIIADAFALHVWRPLHDWLLIRDYKRHIHHG